MLAFIVAVNQFGEDNGHALEQLVKAKKAAAASEVRCSLKGWPGGQHKTQTQFLHENASKFNRLALAHLL